MKLRMLRDMAEASETVAAALQQSGERVSAVVRRFIDEANARGQSPTDMGYIVYRVERSDRPYPETIRLRPKDGSIYYEGESASALDDYVGGLPFYVMDGRLVAGRYPPPEVVGVERTVAAITEAAELLSRLLDEYLETGTAA
jgi:hypothetical protein